MMDSAETDVQIAIGCLLLVAMIITILGCWGIAIAARGWARPDDLDARIRRHFREDEQPGRR